MPAELAQAAISHTSLTRPSSPALPCCSSSSLSSTMTLRCLGNLSRCETSPAMNSGVRWWYLSRETNLVYASRKARRKRKKMLKSRAMKWYVAKYRSDLTGPFFLLSLGFWTDRLRTRDLDLDSEELDGSEGRNGFRSCSRCWALNCLRLKAASSAAERPLVAIADVEACSKQYCQLRCEGQSSNKRSTSTRKLKRERMHTVSTPWLGDVRSYQFPQDGAGAVALPRPCRSWQAKCATWPDTSSAL
jgi:hypothetical protein